MPKPKLWNFFFYRFLKYSKLSIVPSVFSWKKIHLKLHYTIKQNGHLRYLIPPSSLKTSLIKKMSSLDKFKSKPDSTTSFPLTIPCYITCDTKLPYFRQVVEQIVDEVFICSWHPVFLM